MVMFLETAVMCSALNQTLMAGNGARKDQGKDGQWASLGPSPVQPYSAWSVVLMGSSGDQERFCLAALLSQEHAKRELWCRARLYKKPTVSEINSRHPRMGHYLWLCLGWGVSLCGVADT